ncbi:MAG: glycine cleavage system protein GcvH, partial [Chitinivibrionales bacterium]|nr:glycine cleavage system protein GcvH [Chitinivibrionales bacterium]MBD3356370.1 glycine cleavage system protein GcvH [Chitinivibrionales bacterium]
LAVVGISDHAQESLGDITFVELPSMGKSVEKGKECGVIESVKAASDLYSPLTGEIAEVNTGLESTPEKINASPHDEGWLFKVRGFNPSDLESLMDASAYTSFLEKNG